MNSYEYADRDVYLQPIYTVTVNSKYQYDEKPIPSTTNNEMNQMRW